MVNLLNEQIEKELLNFLRNDASILQIAKWADRIYSDHCRELDVEMDKAIIRISFMQYGSEF
jgi:hypothetical protein